MAALWSNNNVSERIAFMNIAKDYLYWFLELTNSTVTDEYEFVENNCCIIIENIIDIINPPFDITLVIILIASFKIIMSVYTDDIIDVIAIKKIIKGFYNKKHIVIYRSHVNQFVSVILQLIVNDFVKILL